MSLNKDNKRACKKKKHY